MLELIASMLGGIGVLMGPVPVVGGTPGGGFAITTEAGVTLAAENNSILVTEAAP